MLKYNVLVLFLLLIPASILAKNIVPTPRYRTPKNIAFSTQGGGSSHHFWVLEILKEMSDRGHNVSLFSRGDQLRFAKDYPLTKTREVGGDTDFLRHPLLTSHLTSHLDLKALSMGVMEVCMMNYSTEFFNFQNLFQSEKTDLVICDAFSISCIDTAIVSKLPVIITTTMGFFSDDAANYINNKLYSDGEPTTKHETLWERIYRDYVTIPKMMREMSKRLRHVHNFQKKLGLQPNVDVSAERYNHIPKLVNNVFGIEVARKHSPLLHMVGPIIRSSYPSLDSASMNFLESHKNIVYIAFGQHAKPNDRDVRLIMQTLLRLLDQGNIDGFIWSRLDKTSIPKTIKTPTHVYSQETIINHKDILLIDWAPQFAILEHPSTSVFITHGGIGSLHEALYNGVRLFVYPFFGDQPVNARAIERVGVGKYMDLISSKFNTQVYKLFYQKLHKVILDPQREIQNNADRYSAYVQVASTNAVTRAADLMEESLFASDDQGELFYRSDVAYEIHWIKRHNIDIYAMLSFLVVIAFKLVTWIVYHNTQTFNTNEKKLKRV